MKSLLFTSLFLLTLFNNKINAQKCAEFESILVDACGIIEGSNEMFRFKVGSGNLYVANLNIVWSNNSFQGFCQTAGTAARVAALNRSVKRCGLLLEPTGGVLPAGKSVLVITSELMDTLANSFANLEDTIIVIFQCGSVSAGHFKNFQAGAGARTTIFTFSGPGGCSDTATYVADSLQTSTGSHAAADGASVDFTPSGITTYNNIGCNAPVKQSTIFAGNDTSICAGAIISLKASGSNFKKYFWKGGYGIFSKRDSLNTFYTPSNSDTYPISIIITAYTNCASDSISDTLVINKNNPTVSAGNDTSICKGSIITLQAKGGTAYIWQSNPSLSCTNCNNPTVTTNTTQSYFVDIFSGSCTYRDTLVVTVVDYDILTIGNNVSICSGDSSAITAISSNGYLWTPQNGLSCTNCATPNASPNLTTTYTVSSLGFCPASGQITVNVTQRILPSISISSPTTSICIGETITFSSSVTNEGTAPLLQWYVNGSPVSTGPIFSTSTLGNNDVITCSLTSNATCASPPTVTSNPITMLVSASLTPVISISAFADKICKNQPLNLKSNITNGGQQPLYRWIKNNQVVGNGSSYSDQTPMNGDNYQCILTSSSPCASVDSALSNIITATVYDLPIADAGIDSAIYLGTSIVLNGSGGITYLWLPNSSLSNLNTANPIASPSENTTYYLLVTDQNGCSAKDSVIITIKPGEDIKIILPTAFSPNKDGVNDAFGIINGYQLKTTEMRIYNRWGERIFETTDKDEWWDGTYKGIEQGLGVYIVNIKATTIYNKSLSFISNLTLLK